MGIRGSGFRVVQGFCCAARFGMLGRMFACLIKSYLYCPLLSSQLVLLIRVPR